MRDEKEVMNMNGRRFTRPLIILWTTLFVGLSCAVQAADLATAAAAGDAHAQFLLGKAYNSGQGQAKDTALAAKWFNEAAQQKHHEALFHLGVMFEQGRGVNKDVNEAARLYRKAANAGNVDAMYTLSMMYQSGRGVPQNSIQAEFWYRKATDFWDSAALLH
jgi:TPR repeat protein